MSMLDEMKEELDYEVSKAAEPYLAGKAKLVSDAIQVGFKQLDAGATYAEALDAAKQRLKEAV
jgi:hypothetical protein